MRHVQGSTRAFLVLKDMSGHSLAYGDVIQAPHKGVVEGEVPVIVAEQGQLFQGGPVWRVELASPTWPALKASQ